MTKIPISEIDSISEAMESDRYSIQMKRDPDSIVLEKGSKRLKINGNGKVSGSMPLHNFEVHNAESIEIEENEVTVYFDGGKYDFRF